MMKLLFMILEDKKYNLEKNNKYVNKYREKNKKAI